MKVRIKKMSENAVIPAYAHATDAGLDLTATSVEFDYKSGCLVYGTGLAFEIPEGYVGYIFPRSSVYKTPLAMTNCVGVIDSGYRGEVKAIFRSADCIIAPKNIFKRLLMLFRRKQDFTGWEFDRFSLSGDRAYKVGDRVAQLIIMPYPQIEFEESTELSETDRGIHGHGSTGK